MWKVCWKINYYVIFRIDTNEPATHYVQEEQEYWKKFVSSRSTIDNLSLGAENTPNRSAADTPSLGGHERSAFQPVVAPGKTQYLFMLTLFISFICLK